MASKAEKASNRQIAVFVLIGTMIGAAFPFSAPAGENGETRGEIASFVSDSFASFSAWLTSAD